MDLCHVVSTINDDCHDISVGAPEMLDVVVAAQGGEEVGVKVVDPVRQTSQLNAAVNAEARLFNEWTRKPVATVDLRVALLGLALAPEFLQLLLVAGLAT